MDKRSAILGAIVFLCSPLLNAQQVLIGTYEGGWVASYGGHDFPNFGTLKIMAADGEIVRGTFKMQNGTCAGDYPIEGRYFGNRLEIQTGEGGGVRGCGKERFVLEVKDTKLVGTYMNFNITLTRK